MINMNNITFAEAEAGHRELWDWLAETGGNFDCKRDWSGWGGYDRRAGDACFACEIAGNCSFCPIEWPNELICNDSGSLYDDWDKEGDPAERKRLAAEIRDLPWKEK
jgi:hypothetical protein